MIFIGPPNKPDKATQLVVGGFSNTLRAAQRKGMQAYFETYLDRYGFKHPEDPTRTRKDGPLPATVVTLKEGDHYSASHTYDEDAEVSNVAG